MPDQLFNRRDLITYFIIAATGALSQLIVAALMQEWFVVTYEQALAIGYWFSFFVGYFLTRLFAFNVKNKTQSKREAIKYSLVAILSSLITIYGSAVLYTFSKELFGERMVFIPFSVKRINLNKLSAQVIAMGASFLSNYVLHKRFTFYDTGFYERLKRLLGI